MGDIKADNPNINSISLSLNKNKTTEQSNEPADFETAISATGYGWFNYLLIILCWPCCFTAIFCTSSVSYILPSAECDLNLTIVDKGLLNGITYVGMISSAFFWGFLSDTLGRKKLLVYGYFLNAICEICVALSQKMWFLMLFKFLGGAIVSGPFAVLMSFLSEFHGVKHRARVMLSIGFCFSFGSIFLALIAYAVLTNTWTIVIIENQFVIHAWQIFLLVCSTPTIISGLLVLFFPESPKFLMSRGRNEEALKVFQTVFHINTRKPKSEYPIKILINEIEKSKQNEVKKISNEKIATLPKNEEKKFSGVMALRTGFSQIAPMFHKPYLYKCILVFSIQFAVLLGLNTLRLWLPQLFAIITEYEQLNVSGNNDTSGTLCDMIEHSLQKSEVILKEDRSNCNLVFSGETYLNSMYVGIVQLIGYMIAGVLINALGNRRLLIIVLLLSGCCGSSLFLARNSFTTLALSSLYVGLASIASTALVGVTVNLFPTSLRTMTVSLTMMFGRIGAFIGNILFPYFLSLGCIPPFAMIGSTIFLGAIGGFFLPETNKNPLQ